MATMPANRPADRNVEGVMHHLKDYLAVRIQHAIRVNPRIANIIDDIVWAQVENLRQVMEKPKSFGPERVRVADILASDLELRRKALFSHSDQNSIIFEIINKADDQKRAMSELAVHNMRTFFRALDPSLEMIVELIQHWLLWDLNDASYLYNFDEQSRRINTLLGMEIPEELRNRYRTALQKKPDDPLADADILQFEMKRLEHTLQAFVIRRTEEEAFMAIIRREQQTNSASAGKIKELAEHYGVLERLESLEGELPDELRASYAAKLNVHEADATRELAIDHEKRGIAEAKRLLEHYLEDDRLLGEPFDYKKHQTEVLKERFAAMVERFRAKVPAPEASAVH